MAAGGILYRKSDETVTQTAAPGSGKTQVGAGTSALADSSLTATVVNSAAGILGTATPGTDYTNLAFKTIAVSGQSDVVADSAADTLTLVASTNMTITTSAAGDSITFASSGGGGGTGTVTNTGTLTSGTLIQGNGGVDVTLNATTATVANLMAGVPGAATAGTDYTNLAFKTIAVSGQSDVVADTAADTLTFAAGTGVTLTTDASTDTVTIAASGASAFWTQVTAGSDQDISSNTTPATDNELFFTMVANKLYEFELHLLYSSPAGSTTPDLKFGFTGPATLTGQHSDLLYVGTADSLTGAIGQFALTTTGAIGTATTPRMAYCKGWAFSTAGGSGSSGFQFQWSQNTSSVNATRRLAGSCLLYRQLSV